MTRLRRTGSGVAVRLLLVVVCSVLSLSLAPVPVGAAPTAQPVAPRVPLFAFYYIWFDPSSWDRAKIDYPSLGRYSSDDPRVMAQHIEWAKAAGIDGFIVSWKDNTNNDRRLRLLMDVARKANFKLAMIYQGLDFSRNPLPVAQVAADFVTFRDQFANDPVFYRVAGKPLTIWSGTWAFSHADVAQVTDPVRGSMLVLNTEKGVADYQRIANVTDGDAYYWSSVNPDTNPNYGTKLNAMADAIHQDRKYWIAPFAPGFDARLVGGSNVVDRKDGAILRTEYATALHSSPDALGLISWNEFSENSYVEPSVKFGRRYLDVLRELRTEPLSGTAGTSGSGADGGIGPDSGDGPALSTADGYGRYWPTALLIAFPIVLAIGVGLIAVRRRRSGRTDEPEATLVGEASRFR